MTCACSRVQLDRLKDKVAHLDERTRELRALAEIDRALARSIGVEGELGRIVAGVGRSIRGDAVGSAPLLPASMPA